MRQLWTIIFATLLAIGWSLAAWHDRQNMKRRQRKEKTAKVKRQFRRFSPDRKGVFRS